MKNIIFIAPPAAGKGTQSELLCNKYGLLHISTGDLLREESKKNTELGQEIKEKMSTGKLIDDSIIIELLKNKLIEIGNKSIILDGFPRTVVQAEAYDDMLDELNLDLGYVIVLDVDKELLEKRIVGRVSCPKCGNVYNELIEESKPMQEGLCNNCHTKLVKRADDNSESFKVRYETYLNTTKPLISYYESKGCLYHVDGNSSKHQIFDNIVNILEKI